MIDYKFSELKAHCDKMFEEYGEQACEKCGESEIGKICLGHFKSGVSELPDVEPRDLRKVTKLLYVEDGSVDVEELKQMLPDNIKIVTYRQGSQKPALANLYESTEDF